MIRSIFIINNEGMVIIEKHYRGTTSRDICDYFWQEVCKYDKRVNILPLITTPKYYLVSIYTENLFFLAVLSQEMPPLLVIELLHRIKGIFRVYFGTLSEATIKENFTIVYQILEEMLDNGFPVITEPNALIALISPPSAISRVVSAISGKSAVSTTLPKCVVTQMPWRTTGLLYTRDEIFFDIAEEIDCIIGSDGKVVRYQVIGYVGCNCRLSGVPDLSLTFLDPSAITDVSFHPCVRYARYERDQIISFVPPDGIFRLLKYRVAEKVHICFQN